MPIAESWLIFFTACLSIRASSVAAGKAADWGEVDQWLTSQGLPVVQENIQKSGHDARKIVGEKTRQKEVISDLSTLRVRGVSSKVRTSSARVSAAGDPFAWERGAWLGAVPSVCGIARELLGTSDEAIGRAGVPPKGARIVDACPLEKCLSYGVKKQASNSAKKRGGDVGERVLDSDAVDAITSLFANATRVTGAKSPCFRIPGALRAKDPTTPGKLLSVVDAGTLLCSRKHGGVPCCEVCRLDLSFFSYPLSSFIFNYHHSYFCFLGRVEFSRKNNDR